VASTNQDFFLPPSKRPHLLPAETVLAAHLAPHLAAQQSQLNAKLQTSQAHNRKLFEEIQAQRAELTALVVEVERAVADVEGANGLLGEVGEELAGETRAVEVEMGGT
jgi:kinetochore protein NNF1